MFRLMNLAYAAYLKFETEDGWPIASHISLSVLTSVFPFLIFVGAVAGFFGTPEIADKAAELLFDAWPPDIARPLAAEIHRVLTTPRGGLLTIGGLLSLYFSASGVEALRIGLNRAYALRDARPWWLLRLEAILFVLMAAIALLAFTFLMVVAPLIWLHLQAAAPETARGLAKFYTPVRYGVSSAVILLVLVITHKYLPAGKRSLRMIAPGVFVTMAAWLGFGAAFGAFLASSLQSYVATYAGLASIMIAVIFLNWLAAMLLYGGALNQVIAQTQSEKKGRDGTREA
jgi:membrane protein